MSSLLPCSRRGCSAMLSRLGTKRCVATMRGRQCLRGQNSPAMFCPCRLQVAPPRPYACRVCTEIERSPARIYALLQAPRLKTAFKRLPPTWLSQLARLHSAAQCHLHGQLPAGFPAKLRGQAQRFHPNSWGCALGLAAIGLVPACLSSEELHCWDGVLHLGYIGLGLWILQGREPWSPEPSRPWLKILQEGRTTMDFSRGLECPRTFPAHSASAFRTPLTFTCLQMCTAPVPPSAGYFLQSEAWGHHVHSNFGMAFNLESYSDYAVRGTSRRFPCPELHRLSPNCHFKYFGLGTVEIVTIHERSAVFLYSRSRHADPNTICRATLCSHLLPR